MDNTMDAIAARIKNRRLELGYSYQTFANLTGMNKSSLQRYETGGIANIPLHRLKTIADALEVSPSWLMGWDAKSSDFGENLSSSDRSLLAAYQAAPQQIKDVVDLALKPYKPVHVKDAAM